MGIEEAKALMVALAPKIASLGARINHFKICSTFDSSPETGNIAAVADALGAALRTNWTAILGGQPSLGRYCLFGTLFAAASDGTIHRIDRHPVMKNHPITPMAEADLRCHLAEQGWPGMSLVDYRICAEGYRNLIQEIASRIAAGEKRVLIDVSSDRDLATIGQALWDMSAEEPLLCVGASSVAQAILPPALSQKVAQRGHLPRAEREGPVLAISGSRSATTQAQIDAAKAYETIRVAAEDFEPSALTASGLEERCVALLSAGVNVLVAVTPSSGSALGGRMLSHALAGFTAKVVEQARPGRLVVAGGDTSSAIVSALDVESLEFVRDVDRGVSLVKASANGSADGLFLALKGGQMGAPGLFDLLAAG